MSSFGNFGDINTLSTLLQESRELETQFSKGEAQPPISGGVTNVVTGKAASYSKIAEPVKAKKDPKEIWDIDEVCVL